jgi:flagellar protein FliL
MAAKESKKNEKPSDPKMDESIAGADGESGDPGAEGGKRRRFAGKTLVLFCALPALLLCGLGVGGYYMFFNRATAEAAAPEVAARPVGIFMNLPELIVNLNTGQRRANFLKITIALELQNQTDVARIEAQMPRIVDTFQVYLRELRLEDLRGSAGMFRLREELLARVNAATQPVQVTDVLFREMLVQ